MFIGFRLRIENNIKYCQNKPEQTRLQLNDLVV